MPTNLTARQRYQFSQIRVWTEAQDYAEPVCITYWGRYGESYLDLLEINLVLLYNFPS